MTTEQSAAAVIAKARDLYVAEYGQTRAAFDRDYGLGRDQAHHVMDRAIGLVGADNTWALTVELGQFAHRCSKRRYTGWSTQSAGPVRYAREG